MSEPRIIVALDYPRAEPALVLARTLRPELCRLKIGKELFTIAGPQLIEKLMQAGFDIFLDLKFHDIPHTVAAACKAAASLGVWMVNVHASGGRNMLLAAREALATSPTKLIAVTLLTSMNRDDLQEIGWQGEPNDVVQRLALLARDCGLDGVVCSALETAGLRQLIGHDFDLVTPGIRPVNSRLDDQQRIATPRQAIQQGASYLVIGRPITQATDPLATLIQLNQAIAS
ncbi:orotidine-5'-phosphate decarboxylase [Nitrosomonas cryotolerans]|uniref:Orotidine 5'-phosphate decarboxylase n=1 Tax=Nitrosomonas cryotolerans ATCC 49181 TaxID=1131553 RepID=A0A1N6GY33_9PROT|nr:orotidine-5'-phosphate decarboxylase [Nitrosomonas cryotolerans]SFP42337.1 orotidine-5'-phosphate decarboxylase [Nitrosomonas cryotolerans]SIO12285.1 orotidine-5'-phosphate decarboxylase [Nitrosomonas cryotolerans ATCC 49181]